MALFGGKPDSLPQVLKKVQTRAYQTAAELDQLLEQLAAFADLRPKQIVPLLSDTNPRVREFAGKEIALRAGERSLSLMLGAMVPLDTKVRRELAAEVVKAPIPAILAAIGPMSHSRVTEERAVVLDVVAAHEAWPEFLSVLKSALKDPEPTLRQRSVRIMRRAVKHPAIRLIFCDLMHSPDDVVRHEIIAALASHPQTDIVEPFFARLPEEERREQQLIVDALGELAKRAEVEFEERLLPILAADDQNLRELALRLLASMPNRAEVLRTFIIHSRGLATWIRERVSASILRLSNDLVPPLLELMQDPDDEIKVGALVMLRGSSDDRIVPVVMEVFASTADWWIRSIAAEVLVNFPLPEVIELLISRIEDPEMRYSVIAALGKVGHAGVVPHLLNCLRDPQRGVRMVTLEALKGHDREDVAGVAFECALHDHERSVRQKAEDLLRALPQFGTPFANELAVIEEPARANPTDGLVVEEELDLEMENEDLNK